MATYFELYKKYIKTLLIQLLTVRMSNIYRTTIFFSYGQNLFLCVSAKITIFFMRTAHLHRKIVRVLMSSARKNKNTKKIKNPKKSISKPQQGLMPATSSRGLPLLVVIAIVITESRSSSSSSPSPRPSSLLPALHCPSTAGSARGSVGQGRRLQIRVGKHGGGPHCCCHQHVPPPLGSSHHILSESQQEERIGEERRGEDRLNTRDMLHRTNLSVNSGANCVLLLCNTSMPEDSNHTFFTCSFTNQ